MMAARIKRLNYLKFPGISFQSIFSIQKKGFAKNNNLAASKAKGEYLCLLNNDVFVEDDWLLPMIDCF